LGTCGLNRRFHLNYDFALIAAVLESRSLQEATKAGLKLDLFTDEASIYWTAIVDHYEQFHEVPSVVLFQDQFPEYQHVLEDDGIAVLVHELKTRRLGSDIETAVSDLADVNGADPWEAKRRLMATADNINARDQEGDTDLIAGDDRKEVMHLMSRLRSGAGLMGYPWPWEVLNESSPGVCAGNFIYVYGREKSKKTFLMLFLAQFFEDLGLKVLFFTREMTNDEISLRLYCMRAGLDYGRMLKGELTDHELALLDATMQGFAERGRLLITEQEDGMTGVMAKSEEFKPHVIIHDYIKALADDAMQDKKNPSEHQYVARAADRLASYAKRKKIPVFAVGHANRDGIKGAGRSSAEHAWSDHIIRRVDYSLRIISDDSENRTAVIINAGRSVQRFLGFTLNGRLCDGFGEVTGENAEWTLDYDSVKSAEAKAKAKHADITVPTGTKLTGSSFTKTSRKR